MAALPLAGAVGAYGAVFGMLARGAGMSAGEVAAVDALVFAGAAQFVAVGLWSSEGVPLLAVSVATLAINLRYLLITASLREVLRGPLWKRLIGAHLVVDENWALTMARPPEARSASFLIGSGAAIYAAWNVGGLAGYIAGGGIPNPGALGLDFAFTAAFVALALGMWRGVRADLLPWAAAAAAACIAAEVFPSGWHAVVGAGAGSLALLARPPHGEGNA